MKTINEKLYYLIKHDRKYEMEAYRFIFDSLNYTFKNMLKIEKRHVTGKELLNGCRLYAIDQFGCLAKTVLNEIGIHNTRDIGELVYNLINHNLLGKQDSDKIEDFNNIFNFNRAFNLKPKFKYDLVKNKFLTKYIQKR
ncbi:MAG: hypothetical protein Q7S27_04005 [Nanoarchaeota archaeon]|nr:hypothetical protein [Nanoarchaeota archaeon]